MKKIISLILVICLMAGVLAACGGQSNTPTEPAPNTAEYTRGTTGDTSWSSPWIGLSYTLNDEFTFTSEEQFTELMQITADVILVDDNGNSIVDYSKLDIVYEMMATGKDGSNVIVICEKNKNGYTPQAYMNAVKIQLRQAGMEYTFSAMTEYTIGGKTMSRFDATTNAYGPTMYQTYLLMMQGDRMVQIVASSTNKAMIETMFGAFK